MDNQQNNQGISQNNGIKENSPEHIKIREQNEIIREQNNILREQNRHLSYHLDRINRILRDPNKFNRMYAKLKDYHKSNG